jgi:hypothetical protein
MCIFLCVYHINYLLFSHIHNLFKKIVITKKKMYKLEIIHLSFVYMVIIVFKICLVAMERYPRDFDNNDIETFDKII